MDYVELFLFVHKSMNLLSIDILFCSRIFRTNSVASLVEIAHVQLVQLVRFDVS